MAYRKNIRLICYLSAVFTVVLLSVIFFQMGNLRPLEIQPRMKDFGLVKAGENPEAVFVIRNASSRAIRITYIYTECDCTFEMPLSGKVPAKGIFRLPVKLKLSQSAEKNVDEKIILLIDHPLQKKLFVRLRARFEYGKEARFKKALEENITARQGSGAYRSQPLSGTKYYGAFFYKKGCVSCVKKNRIILDVQKKYPNLIVKNYPMNDRSAILLAEKLGGSFNISEAERLKTPLLVLGDAYLAEEEISREALEHVLNGNSPALSFKPWEVKSDLDTEAAMLNKVKNFSLFGVIAAGLVDGINPCAFATLVFFLSLLTVLKRTRMQIALVGGVFTFSVFLTYFLVGIGVFSGLQWLASVSWLTSGVYFISGLLALLLGVLSLRDARLASLRQFKAMALQLSDAQKRMIQKIISTKSRKMALIGGTFLIGSTISLIELGCTGQVYLPTITFVLKTTGIKLLSFIYLLLYNFMFILPLVMIFLFSLFGVTSEKFSSVFKRHFLSLKITMAVLFFILAVFLIWRA